jgi:hypothetical protein
MLYEILICFMRVTYSSFSFLMINHTSLVFRNYSDVIGIKSPIIIIIIIIITIIIITCGTVYKFSFFFLVALRLNVCHGLLRLEVSRSHTTTHHSR